MKATLAKLPARRRRLGLRDQVGRGARDRLLRARARAAREPQPARHHQAVSRRSARIAKRARRAHGGPRRRAGRLRRARAGRASSASSGGCTSPPRPRSAGGWREVPVTYVIFDLLHLDGELAVRRALRGAPRASSRRSGSTARAGRRPPTTAATARRCSRRAASRGSRGSSPSGSSSAYRPGRRSRDWLKVKNVRSQEVVIGGWLPGKGRREGELGALLVGYYERRRARCATPARSGPASAPPTCACCASGSSRCAATRARSRAASRRRARSSSSPSSSPRSSSREWTNAGTLRHPSYKGLRDDKPRPTCARSRPARLSSRRGRRRRVGARSHRGRGRRCRRRWCRGRSQVGAAAPSRRRSPPRAAPCRGRGRACVGAT